MTFPRIPSAIAGMLTVLAIWVVVAPAALGGQVRAYSIAGASMEPGIHAGDLLLVRPRPSYAPGDVVAFRAPSVGAVLLHRVVSVEGDRLTTRGDANPEVDLDRPAMGEVLGASVLRIPGGARILRTVASPMGLAAFAALWLTLAGRRRRGTSAQRRPLDPDARRTLAQCCGAAAAICAVVAIALPARGDAVPMRDAAYTHTGALTYQARQPRAIYPQGRATSGQAVFVAGIEHVSFAFAYHLTSDEPHELSGTIALRAQLSDGHGWSRPMTLVPETPFHGDVASVEGTVSLRKIARIRARLDAAAGMPRSVLRLELLPAVELRGSLASATIHEAFTPSIPFEHDGSVLALGTGVDPATDPLAPSTARTARVATSAGADVTIAGNRVRAGTVRAVGLLLAAAFAIGAFAVRRGPAPRTGASGAVRGRFAERCIAVGGPPTGELHPVLSRGDFERLAARSDEPIFVHPDPWGSIWILDHAGRRYAYRDPDAAIMTAGAVGGGV